MTPGVFRDSGIRVRENKYSNEESWTGLSAAIEDIYYDVEPYNNDSITVDPEFMKVAEIYFRMSTDRI